MSKYTWALLAGLGAFLTVEESTSFIAVTVVCAFLCLDAIVNDGAGS